MRRLFQRSGATVAALGILVTAAAAQSPAAQTPPAPQPKSPRNWTELRVPEEGFRVEFPAAPRNTNTVEGAAKSWAVELDNGYTAYLLSFSDLDPDHVRRTGAQGVLDGGVKGGTDRFPGAVTVSHTSIQVGGHPGRELQLKVTFENQPYRVLARMFLIERRLYVFTAISSEGKTDNQEVSRFLDSFALIAR